MDKPIHVKPSLYAVYYYPLKEIALKYGYNLVLHGSLHRDMDLIAIPWSEAIGSHEEMIREFAEFLGGEILLHNRRTDENDNVIGDLYSRKPHGRICYIIDIYRGGYSRTHGFTEWTYNEDPQFYLDISVTPVVEK